MSAPKPAESSQSGAQHPVGQPPRVLPIWQQWWLAPLVLAVIVCVVFVIMLLPRRTVEFTSVDGQNRWEAASAPPRRNIVWQPAVPATPLTARAGAKDSLIRPQLDDDGTTLYFTRRAADGSKDIYRSRLVAGTWQPAKPVAELNTEADDIGPIIQAGGKVLYLYSDREDGYGGFDIYVSRRADAGWSEPVNLGPTVNSPAHEYDPAITSDGRVLYFASNRSPRMQRLMRAGEYQDRADHWQSTLRADLGLNKFDIYRATRTSPADAWRTAQAAEELNRDDSHEGSPFVSSDNAFLYFVSDRPQRSEEEANLDIFRARIGADGTSDPENLGPGVNTPLNELEPALSPEGFRIYFSRNLEDAKGRQQYSLFSSTAVEIEEQAAWDDSNWQAFAGGIANFLRTNWWWILLALLLLATLAALVWFLREVSLSRATVPTFLLAAILLHILLGFSSYLVTFGDGVFADIRRKIKDVVEAPALPTPDPSNKPEQEAFNKISEQLAIETVDTPEMPRQTTEPQNVPLPTDRALPTITQVKPRQTDVNRQRPAVPQVQPRRINDPLQRRRPIVESVAETAVPLEETQREQTIERQIQPEDVDVSRQPLKPRIAVAPPVRRRTIDPALELVPAAFDAERSADRPAETTPSKPSPLDRKRPVDTDVIESSAVAPEAIAQALEPAERRAKPQPVTVKRTLPQQHPDAEAPVPRRMIQPNAARLTIDASSVEPIQVNQPVPDAVAQSRPNFKRPAAPRILPDASEIETDAIGGAVATKPTNVLPIGRAPVNVPRQEIGHVQAPPSASPEFALPRSEPPRPQATDVAAEPTRTESSALPGRAEPSDQLARAEASLKAMEALANEQIPSDSLPVADAPSPDKPRADAVGVTVPRQADASGDVATDLPPVRQAATFVELARRSAASDLERAKYALGENVRGADGRPDVSRARRTDNPIAGEAIEAEAIAPAALPSAEGQLASLDVGVSRDESLAQTLDLDLGKQLGGPHRIGDPRLRLGHLARENVNTALATNPLGTRFLPRPARPRPMLLFAEDNIGLQAVLRLRQIDPEAKKDLVRSFGGDEKNTLPAIQRGLKWLATQQHEDGRWKFNEFKKVNGKMPDGTAGTKCDAGATGFALLPFLGDGNTHREGEYRELVARGIRWLVDNQQASGELTKGNEGNPRMYGHGIAAIALCEAYALTRDPALHEPAQRAVDFIVAAQDKKKGGWRYQPGHDSDTSVVGWQVMALKSAQMGDLDVPKSTLDNARRYLVSVRGKGKNLGRFGYSRPGDVKNAMTAEALLCMQYLGAQRDDSVLQLGAQHLLKNLPKQGKDNSYYWYYGTQVMFHLEGDYWKQWNDAFSPLLIGTQRKDGHMAGTWDPKDEYERSGGRIFSTSLRVLMLEAFYRHLPLYRVLED